MTAVILTFLASFIGAVLLLREERRERLAFRALPVIGGTLLLVLGALAFMVAFFRYMTT